MVPCVPKLYLRKTEASRHITFDNTTFSVTEEKKLDCQYGQHYFHKRESKSNRLRLQGTRKIGCQATIRIKTFTLYTDYALGDVSGKVHGRSSYCRKSPWRNYEMLFLRERYKLFVSISFPYLQRKHTQVILLAVQVGLDNESTPCCQRRSPSWYLQG